MRFPFFLTILAAVPLFLAACQKPTPDEVREKMKSCNPAWSGELATGYYSLETPVFEFGENSDYNAIAVSGNGVRDFSPLEPLSLRILSLRRTDVPSLDFLKDLQWEKDTFMDLQNCPELKDFTAIKYLPAVSVSMTSVPKFHDTSLFGERLKSLLLNKTGVRKFEFRAPEKIEELQFISLSPEADVSQIGKMTSLRDLTLENIAFPENVDFSKLVYLENISISKTKMRRLPSLAPETLRSVWIADSPDLESLESLSGKVIDRLCIMRSGDPAKLLANMNNTKINLLVVNGADVSDVRFLKKIKNLNCVRFQNCKGLPSSVSEPFVEVIIENL